MYSCANTQVETLCIYNLSKSSYLCTIFQIEALYICTQILETVALLMYKFSNGSRFYTPSQTPKKKKQLYSYFILQIFVLG